METFPIIESTQYVLMRADINTGHVLDEDFRVAISDTQKVYTIIDSVEDGIEYIKSVFVLRDDIEFVVYDSNHELLKYICRNNLDELYEE